jgi:hypothetical protein
MKYRTYTDTERAEALAALDSNNGNVEHTAQQLEMPRKTLEEWAKGRGVTAAVEELRVLKRGELSDKFEALAHTIVDSVTPEDIAKASLRDKTIAVGILTEKVRLLRDQPTVIAGREQAWKLYVKCYFELRYRFDLPPEEVKWIMVETLNMPPAQLAELNE